MISKLHVALHNPFCGAKNLGLFLHFRCFKEYNYCFKTQHTNVAPTVLLNPSFQMGPTSLSHFCMSQVTSDVALEFMEVVRSFSLIIIP